MRLCSVFILIFCPLIIRAQEIAGKYRFPQEVEVISAAVSTDGKKIASGSEDKTVKVWDTATGRELRSFQGHGAPVSSVAFSPDGKRVLSGSRDKTLKMWDVVSGRELRTFRGHHSGITSVTFSPDGKRVLSGSSDETLKLWDAESGNEIRTLEGGFELLSVAFSPDGNKVLAGGTSVGKAIKLWAADSGRELGSLGKDGDIIAAVAFSPDGKKILSGSFDGTIKLWNADTGKELRVFFEHADNINYVGFSPDGTKILGGSQSALKIWNTDTSEMTGNVALEAPVSQIFFNRAGDNLLIVTSAGWMSVHIEEPVYGSRNKGVQKAGEITFEEKIQVEDSPVPALSAGFARFVFLDDKIRESTEGQPARFTQGVVSVRGQWLADFDLNSSEFSLLLNGEPVTDGGKSLSSAKKNKTDISLSQTISLKKGINYVQWKLESRGREAKYSEVKYLFYDDVSQPDLYLYAIGVASDDLKYTRNDAYKIKEIFESQKGVLFREVNAAAITGERTDAASLKKLMESIGNDHRIRPQDMILLFFSSHGLPAANTDFILLARDYDDLTPKSTSLNYQEDILANLERRPSKRVIFLDACYSGKGAKARPDITKALADTPPGFVIISSSSGSELSYEDEKWEHGSFTYALSRALKTGEADTDDDKVITVSELYEYLKVEVPRQNRSAGRPAQNPDIRRKDADDFPVFILK